MRGIRVLCVLAASVGIAAAQPTVAAVANAASNILNGLPNSGLAEGSIAVAYGQNLGPAEVVVAYTLPWPKELAGTSAQITIGGESYDLPIYYTLASQIAFLVPSVVPPGGGTIRVTYNGQTSATSPVQIVARNLGLFTLNSRGTGAAIITYPDYTLVSQNKADDCGAPLIFCGAANPGQTLSLWATGLGPVPVAGDETTTPLPGDLPELRVRVLVGGVSANVVYRGRSGCCIAEDQIVFVVPENISGCSVPIAVQIGLSVSNFATIAIAPDGSTCIPFTPNAPDGALQQLSAIDSPVIGDIRLTRRLFSRTDRAEASFARANAPGSTVAAGIDDPPLDTCRVWQYFNAFGPTEDDPFDAIPIIILDAGPSIEISRGGRNRTVVKGPEGGYEDTIGDTSVGNYLDPGEYMVTAPGGADIGGFSTSITVPQPLVWSNPPANNTPVPRADGMTINWTGGDPNGSVVIEGDGWFNPSGNQDTPPRAGVRLLCRVRAAPGTFFVPDSVLNSLPAQNVNGPRFGTANLSLSGFSASSLISAQGLDVVVARAVFEIGGVFVRFQ